VTLCPRRLRVNDDDNEDVDVQGKRSLSSRYHAQIRLKLLREIFVSEPLMVLAKDPTVGLSYHRPIDSAPNSASAADLPVLPAHVMLLLRSPRELTAHTANV